MVMTRQQIDQFMQTYFEDVHEQLLDDSQYVIDHEGKVSIMVSASLRRKVPGGTMPFKLDLVDGDFSVDYRVFTLNNMPDVVVGEFSCSHCNLDSLQGAPHTVYDSFNCSHNQLTSLAHAPHGGRMELSCDHNLLEDLSTAPACEYLWAVDNPIKSLLHIPSHVKRLAITVTHNLPLLHLVTCECERVDLYDEHKKQLEQLEMITNKYVGKGKRYMLNFALELKQSGYGSNAVW